MDGPEARARRLIDAVLAVADWIVQDCAALNLHAGPGIALREAHTATGPADYLLLLDRRACGVLEAKPEGTTLLGVLPQGQGYAHAAPASYPNPWGDPLPFTWLSSGSETLFQDARDPQPGTQRARAARSPGRRRCGSMTCAPTRASP